MKHDTIANYAASFKSEIDNDSIVYILKNGYAFAMARELVQKQLPSVTNKDGYFNYFEDLIKKHASNSELENVLYKNNAGVWVKLFLILRDYKNITQLFEQANNYDIYINYVASKTIIPELYFTDKDNKMWKINAKDGVRTFHKKTFNYIDTLDKNTVEFVQCNMDHPEYGFSLRHLMSDLKIIFKRHSTDNLLITLNGRFVNPEKKVNEENVLYIRNARYYYKLSNNNLVGKNTNFKEAITNGFKNASLELEEGSSYLSNWVIDSDINILAWNDVKISKWMEVNSITYTNEVYDYQNVRLINYLTFKKELNPKNTIILCDGKILDDTEYIIDGKKVYLKYEHAKFGVLYRHFKDIGKGKRSVWNALNVINNQYYHAIEFTDAEEGQPLEIRKTHPVDIDLMGNGSVLFNDPIGTNDLIVTDGKIVPYTISSNGLIHYEKFNSGDLFGDYTKYTDTELINVFQQKAVKLNLSKYRASVKYEEKITIELDTNGDDYEITSNDDYVSIEKRGKSFVVTGVKEGETTVKVRSFKQFESDGYLSTEREVVINILPPIQTEINVYLGRDSRTPIENDIIEIPYNDAEKTIELIVKTDASDFTLNYDETDENNKLFIVDRIKNHIYIDTYLPNIEMQGKSFTFSITAQAIRSWERVEETTKTYILRIQNSDKIECYSTDLQHYKNAFASNIVKFNGKVEINKSTFHIPHLINDESEEVYKILTDADSLDYELIYDNPNHTECLEYFKIYSDKTLLPLEVTDGEESRVYENIKVGTFKINYSGFNFTPFCSAKLKVTYHKENYKDLVKEYKLLGFLRDNKNHSKTKDICIRINEQESLDDSVSTEIINCSNKEIGVYRVNSDPTRFMLNTSIKCTYLIDNPDKESEDKLIEVEPDTVIPVEIVPFHNTVDENETLAQMQTNKKYPIFGFAIKYKPVYVQDGEKQVIDTQAQFDGYVKIQFWNAETDTAINENVSYTIKINAKYIENDKDKNIEVSNLISNYNDYFYDNSVSLLKFNNGVLNKVQNPDIDAYNDLKFIMSYECKKQDDNLDDSVIFSDFTYSELAKDESGNSLVSLFIKRKDDRLDSNLEGTVTLTVGYGYEPKDKDINPDTVYNPDTIRVEKFKFLNKTNKNTLFDLLIIKNFDSSIKESDITRVNINFDIIDTLDVLNDTNKTLNDLNNFTNVETVGNKYKYELNNEFGATFYENYNEILNYDEVSISKDEEAKKVLQNRVLIHDHKTYRTKTDFIMSDWETDKDKMEEYYFEDKNKLITYVKPTIPWLPTIRLFPYSMFTIDLTNTDKNKQRKYASIDVVDTTENDIVVGNEVHLQFFSENNNIVINSDSDNEENKHKLNEEYVEYAIGTDFLVICAETNGTAFTCARSNESGIVSVFKKELEFNLSDENLEKVEFEIINKDINDIIAPFSESIEIPLYNIDDYDYTLNNDNVVVLRDENKNLIVYGVKKGTTEITLVGKKEGLKNSDPVVIQVTVSKINGEDTDKKTLEFVYPLDINTSKKIRVPFYRFNHKIDNENIITAVPTGEVAELSFTAKQVGSTNIHINLLEKNIKNKKIERFELVNFYEITTLN